MGGNIDLFESLKTGLQESERYRKTVRTRKILEADGTYSSNDVMSESDTNGDGTAWKFEFGHPGKIVEAKVVTPTSRTSAITLYLYESIPTCELDDNAANTGPLVADLAFFAGKILLTALVAQGGPSSTVVTLTNPVSHRSKTLYVVVVDGTGEDFGDDTTLDVILTSELDK